MLVAEDIKFHYTCGGTCSYKCLKLSWDRATPTRASGHAHSRLGPRRSSLILAPVSPYIYTYIHLHLGLYSLVPTLTLTYTNTFIRLYSHLHSLMPTLTYYRICTHLFSHSHLLSYLLILTFIFTCITHTCIRLDLIRLIYNDNHTFIGSFPLMALNVNSYFSAFL